MRTPLFALLLSLSLPTHAAAVFSDHVLRIPEVLVQRAQGPVLYRNVELELRQDGSFAFRGADLASLANIQSISVEADAYPPGTVVVQVQGTKSMACIGVEPAHISRTGNTFHFAIVELPPPDNVRCITAVVPLSTEFGIVTTDLVPGTYEIVYGELRVEFTLHAQPHMQ
jgi:hypothetical protein